jgi:hypothetical protein
MTDDTIAHSVCQKQIRGFPFRIEQRFNVIDYTQPLFFVPECFMQLLFTDLSQDPFSQMTKRGVTQIMGIGNSLNQFRIQAQILTNRSTDRSDLIDMFDAGANMIILCRKKHLRLMFQSAICRRMNDTRKIAAKFRAEVIGPVIQVSPAGNSRLPVRMMRIHPYRRKRLFHLHPFYLFLYCLYT